MTFSPRSLQHLSLIQSAIVVCSDPLVKKLTDDFEIPLCLFSNDMLENCMSMKRSMKLPQNLEMEVMKLLKPISLEIEKWKEDHSRVIDTGIDLTNYFVWKNAGIIDRQATAMALIQSDHLLDVKHRFALACFYCFSGPITTLWKEISPLGKTRIVCRSEIVHLWKSWLESGSVDMNDSFFYWSLLDDNPFATCFVLSKLSPEERDKYLESIHSKIGPLSVNVLAFCYTQLDENSRTRLFQKYPLKMLQWFLNWPLQGLFLEKAEIACEYLSELEFQAILFFIFSERILTSWQDFNYVDLLQKFWNQSPSKFKSFVLNGAHGPLFQRIFEHDWTTAFPMMSVPLYVKMSCSFYRLMFWGGNYKLRRKSYIDLLIGSSLMLN